MVSFKHFLLEKIELRRIGYSGFHRYKMIDDLSDKDLKTLLYIRDPDDIESIEDASWWTDDNDYCYGIEINGVRLALGWQGEGLKKHIENYGDKELGYTSRLSILRVIKSQIDMNVPKDKVEQLQKEIKLVDSLKPETQNVFKGMIEDL